MKRTVLRIGGLSLLCLLSACVKPSPPLAALRDSAPAFQSAPTEPTQAASATPAIGSPQWLAAVETKIRVLDEQGHGPTVGSEEWMAAVSHKLDLNTAQERGLTPGSEEWKRAVHGRLWGERPAQVIRAVFIAESQERLIAEFNREDNNVTVFWKERRSTLPRAISASGARYASPDEKEVLWNKGDEVTYWLNGEIVFSGSVQNP